MAIDQNNSDNELETSKELVIIESKDALSIFTTEDKLKHLYDEIQSKACSIVPNVYDPIGRAQIKKIAYTVARTKTYIDGIGKELVSEYKELPKRIDAGRKYIREHLQELQDSLKEPLLQWEAEQLRLQIEQEIINCWDEAHEHNRIHDAIKESELEAQRKAQAEHEKLIRQQAIEQERKRAEKEKEEAELRHQAELKRAEERRLMEIEQEKERVRREERQKQEAIARAERQNAERQRREEEELERQKKKVAHRNKIHKEAIQSLMDSCELAKSDATKIIKAIASNSIQHCQINY